VAKKPPSILDPEHPPAFLDVAQVAARTQLSEDTIRDDANRDPSDRWYLRGSKVGGRWRFRWEDVLDWERRRGFPTAKDG